jgi:hypothetical protein
MDLEETRRFFTERIFDGCEDYGVTKKSINFIQCKHTKRILGIIVWSNNKSFLRSINEMMFKDGYRSHEVYAVFEFRDFVNINFEANKKRKFVDR